VPSSEGGAASFGAMGAAQGGVASSAASGVSAVEAPAPAVAVAAQAEADGPVCMMRPGDPGFDECEACQ
jgi:ribonucleoside-diphosphate reductase alpha chain